MPRPLILRHDMNKLWADAKTVTHHLGCTCVMLRCCSVHYHSEPGISVLTGPSFC